jgi:hypothetical protein
VRPPYIGRRFPVYSIILAATDGSDRSRGVLAAALEMLGRE